MYKLISSLKLGIDLGGLARLVGWLNAKNRIFREKILKQADETVSITDGKRAIQLRDELVYHREFCEQARINYSTVDEQESRLIKTAIAYYLLHRV